MRRLTERIASDPDEAFGTVQEAAMNLGDGVKDFVDTVAGAIDDLAARINDYQDVSGRIGEEWGNSKVIQGYLDDLDIKLSAIKKSFNQIVGANQTIEEIGADFQKGKP